MAEITSIDFELIKQVYTECREAERIKIANHFEKHGFEVKRVELPEKVRKDINPAVS